MKFYLPENLDLETLIYDNRPNFKPFKWDKLRYIIHILNALRVGNKDLLLQDFTPINAQKLQRIIQNYKPYLKYLEHDLKIIESDKHYIVGEKSKGYRLVEKYRTPVVAVAVNDFSLRQRLKIDKNKNKLSLKNLDYLTKWYNEKLQINIGAVNGFLNEEFIIKSPNKDLWDYSNGRKKYKIPLHQYNHAKMSAEKIKYQDYFLKRDDNVRRFHTNLTTMRSIIRNGLSYNGEKLISIDIKNSQPYLSTLLLNNRFWVETKTSSKPTNEVGVEVECEGRFIESSIFNKNINIFNINIHIKDSYIMLGDITVSLINKDFSHYIKLVVNGKLYEFLEDVFTKELGETYSSRQEIKSAVFQVLFTDNRFLGQEAAKPKKIFKKYFSDVYEIFAEIKKKDKTLLPRLLQSIESYLIIDVIAKRISKEYPDAPIFTIHDSIATTKEYVNEVERIMFEELTAAIGSAPAFKREEWDINNMSDYLNNLRQKTIEVA
jgi:hypothetical protein